MSSLAPSKESLNLSPLMATAEISLFLSQSETFPLICEIEDNIFVPNRLDQCKILV